jgi:hypothetical protein
MSDGYGLIVVTQSEDFKGNIKKICSALNNCEGWSTSPSEFRIEGNSIYCEGHCFFGLLQYPSASPLIPSTALIDLHDGSFIEKPYEELTDNDYENILADTYEPIALDVLSDVFRKYINKGSLIIASSWYEKGHTISFEELTLNFDGVVKRKMYLHSMHCISSVSEEEFIPY